MVKKLETVKGLHGRNFPRMYLINVEGNLPRMYLINVEGNFPRMYLIKYIYQGLVVFLFYYHS